MGELEKRLLSAVAIKDKSKMVDGARGCCRAPTLQDFFSNSAATSSGTVLKEIFEHSSDMFADGPLRRCNDPAENQSFNATASEDMLSSESSHVGSGTLYSSGSSSMSQKSSHSLNLDGEWALVPTTKLPDIWLHCLSIKGRSVVDGEGHCTRLTRSPSGLVYLEGRLL